MKDTRNSAELLRLATVNYCAQTVLALLCLFEIWNDVCTYRLNTEHFLLLFYYLSTNSKCSFPWNKVSFPGKFVLKSQRFGMMLLP